MDKRVDHEPRSQRANWYRIAFSRAAHPAERRHARRVVVGLEACYLVLALVARFTLPQLSWLGIALLWAGVLILTATLVWLLSVEQRRR
jgi:hypothetical protein